MNWSYLYILAGGIPQSAIDGVLVKNYSEFSEEERLMHDEIKQNLGETGKHFQAVTQDEVEKVFEVSSCHIVAFYLSWAKDLVILQACYQYIISQSLQEAGPRVAANALCQFCLEKFNLLPTAGYQILSHSVESPN